MRDAPCLAPFREAPGPLPQAAMQAPVPAAQPAPAKSHTNDLRANVFTENAELRRQLAEANAKCKGLERSLAHQTTDNSAVVAQ